MTRPKVLFSTLRLALLLLILCLGFYCPRGHSQDTQEAASAEATSAEATSAEAASALEAVPTISMDFQDAHLKDIFKVFSIQSGMNFIASQEIADSTVTLYLDKVPIKEALDKLLRANKLDYELSEQDKIIIVKKAKPEIETITRIFPLRYAWVPSATIQTEKEDVLGAEGEDEGEGLAAVGGATTGIISAIEQVLSEDGTIVEDPRTNSLIITDLPNRFPTIEQTIMELDIPVPQVMLEVEMLDVSKSVVDKAGFNLGQNPFTILLPGHGGKLTKFFIGDLDKRAGDLNTTNIEGSVVLGSTYAGLLDFLRTQTDTRYLARPRILTLNNETAEIKITTDEAVNEVRTVDPESGDVTYDYERTETGVSFRVTPQVDLTGDEITMLIVPKVSEAKASSISTAGNVVDPEERSTKSMIRVKDGETVIVGGLIRNDVYETINKVPILGDIPILGMLFKHKNRSKDIERELLVFITPHIIRDTSYVMLEEESSVILSSREQDAPSDKERLANIDATLDSVNIEY
jgi:type IV pilus assembly protein PilQ